MATHALDDKLASLASLLEADLSVCRSALEKTGGNVANAIEVMFAGETGYSSSSSSSVACFAVDVYGDKLNRREVLQKGWALGENFDDLYDQGIEA